MAETTTNEPQAGFEPALLAQARAEGEAAARSFTLNWGQGRQHQGSGLHSPRNAGGALEFQDQREYQLGDDPRHLNWRAYARTERLLMKQYRSEINPVVDVICDSSASMFTPAPKGRQVLALAWFFHGLGRTGGFRVRLWECPAQGQPRPWTLAAVETGHWQPDTSSGADAAGSISLRLPVPGRSLRVLISDLLFPGDPARVLDAWQGQEGQAWVLAPYCREEAEPDWNGLLSLRDTEGKRRDTRVWHQQALADIRERYRRHMDAWVSACRSRHIGHARVSAELPLRPALLAEAEPAGMLRITR